jgi:predicted metalloprotease with PDZ domain
MNETEDKHKKIYTVDLINQHGYGVGFAAGMCVDLVIKHAHLDHDGRDDLQKAAWYLAKLIAIEYGPEEAQKAIASFTKGTEEHE